jgi:serine protease Do
MKQICLLFIALCITPFTLPATSYHTAHIAAKSKPAVAFIVTETNHFDLAYSNPSSWQEILRPFYEFFYPSEHGLGTGFLISDSGHIVTNEHVIHNRTKVLVLLQQDDGEMQVHPAEVLGGDVRTDVAVVKIEDDNWTFPYLHLGNSHKLHVGEKVICIGNPMGIHSTVSEGIISGLNRNHFSTDNFELPIEGFIQTDAASSPGNSGGPLLNAAGEVIGIISWKFRRIGYDNLSFAVPSHIVRAIAHQILEKGRIAQGFFGAEFERNQEVIFNWALYVDKHEGARIRKILHQSPAECAGLMPGDLILQLHDIPIYSPQSLRNEVCIFPPETALSLTYDRNGMLFETRLTLGSEELSKKHARMNDEPLQF